MSDRYFMPAAIPRSMPTSWITVNCPSLSWQRKRKNDKDKLDCRSRLHSQRNICLSPFYLYLSYLSFFFQCLLKYSCGIYPRSYIFHLTSLLHTITSFSFLPIHPPFLSSPFSGRQCMMWLWGGDSLETELFVNVTKCLNAAFVRYPL